MQLITQANQFVLGRKYWVRNKTNKEMVDCITVTHDAPESWLNNLLNVYDVVGPQPEHRAPDFDKYIKSATD